MGEYTGSIISIVVLVILSGYFSATETAFTSLNKIKIKALANKGDKRAKRVLELSENYDRLITTILIGNNIVNIAMTAVSTVLFIRIYGDYGATIATVAITIIVLIFGEISPKSLAKEAPERFSMFSSGIIKVCTIILTPINFVFSKWQSFITKAFGINGDSKITEQEIKDFVSEAQVVGGIEAQQGELIQNAIGFNEVTAEEVMTPHVDISAIELEMTREEIGEVFEKTGFSRLPLYEDDIDKILGVLNQKDFHNEILAKNRAITDFVKPVAFVAGTMKIATLLKKLQSMNTHMAIVVNEYGGTEGLVTMEDIIEELVGEIFDEHDAIMSQEVTLLQNGSYRVMANANVAKVFDFFEIDSEPDVNTINGWVALELDKLAEKGDSFERTYKDKLVKVKVTKANPRKALEINMQVIKVSTEDEE